MASRPVPACVFVIAASVLTAGSLPVSPARAQQAVAAAPLPDRKPPKPEGETPQAPSLSDIPAKELFSSVTTGAPMAPKPIGFYTAGCLAGGKALPITGPAWQAMRLSRNRNWGHPMLIDFLEELGKEAKANDGWSGLLVGDISQPRGGPMVTGHTSHQVGLDADIWLTPMPDRVLTEKEREDISAVSMLKDPFTVDPDVWTPAHVKLIKRASEDPQVARIFVHPAIKKRLCEDAGSDRGWLTKVRPWWNHYYHFHVRLNCPPGLSGCRNQAPAGGGDGCGAEITNWMVKLRQSEIWKAQEQAKPGKAPPEKPPLKMADLPSQCEEVLKAGRAELLPEPGEPSPMLRAIASKEAGPPLPTPDADMLNILRNGGDPTKDPVPLPDRKPQ
nr:penicillin-insensitive murein endopeptidase [Methyloligella halotolerans]